MLVYVNGDSFVEGCGLADQVYFSGTQLSPKFLSTRDNKAAYWIERRAKLIADLGIAKELSLTNKQMSWAGHLQKLINCELVNNAVGGSSIHGIANRTIIDLKELASSNSIPDYVFIGVTSIERAMIINLQPETDSTRWTDSALPQWHSHLDSSKQRYVNEFWRSHTDEELLVMFLRECILIKSYVKSVTGKDPIFLNTSGTWDYVIEIVKTTKLKIIQPLWDILEFDTVFVDQEPFGKFGQEYPLCLDGHWSEPAHIKYAQYIADTFFNKSK